MFPLILNGIVNNNGKTIMRDKYHNSIIDETINRRIKRPRKPNVIFCQSLSTINSNKLTPFTGGRPKNMSLTEDPITHRTTQKERRIPQNSHTRVV